MKGKRKKFKIGLRTLKTAVAVSIAMIIVNAYGASTSKLIFAMLGAMTAMEPTFRESVRSSVTQIVGVLFGCLVSVVLFFLPLPTLGAAVLGIILVITIYNMFQIHFSPSLPCLIVVIICTNLDINPYAYALERCWDTAIGLGVGMLVNILVFPYDNSRQIRDTAESLDEELLLFLEDMFDGDNLLPDTEKMTATIDAMEKQLKIFSNQRFLFNRKRYAREYDAFRACEGKARQLVAQMEVLCCMDCPGRLSDENRKKLEECGAHIQDERKACEADGMDIVTNYHVDRILILRKELLEALGI